MSESSRMSRTVPTTRRTDDAPVRFGVIGAGFIARWFAEAVAHEPDAQIVAVTSAHRERAAAFAQEHGISHAHASLEEMLAAHGPDSEAPIDVVYVGRQGKVVAVTTMPPNRMGRPRLLATAVVEMRQGDASRLGIRRGSILAAAPTEPPPPSDPGSAGVRNNVFRSAH